MPRIGIFSLPCPDSPPPSAFSLPPKAPDPAPAPATAPPAAPQIPPRLAPHAADSRSSSACAAHTARPASPRPESPATSSPGAGAFLLALTYPKASLTHLPLINLQVVKCNCSRLFAVQSHQNRHHFRQSELPIPKAPAPKSHLPHHRLDHSPIHRVRPRQSSHIIAIHPRPRAAHIFQTQRKSRRRRRHRLSIRHFRATIPHLVLAHIRRALQRPAD